MDKFERLKSQLRASVLREKRLRAALKVMTQTKKCDCGCGTERPIMSQTYHYYDLAKRTLAQTAPYGYVVTEQGNWTSDRNGRSVYSDNFHYDVELQILGDFEDNQQRAAYSEWLSEQLNESNLLREFLAHQQSEIYKLRELVQKMMGNPNHFEDANSEH